MDRAELLERLELLESTDVITADAAAVTASAFDHLTSTVNKMDLVKGEMLFTHLCTALSRLERGEPIEAGPHQTHLDEVKKTGLVETIEKQIDYIENELGKALPQEEKNYLYLHYTYVIQHNLKGHLHN
jgi:transcriptional regulatory protein LevR